MLSVGASDGADQRALYGGGQGSNWSNGIDVVAPGVTSLVYTTKRVSEGSEGSFSGTSAAAPVVAGIAALLKSQNPDLHRDDIEQLIKLSAEKVPGYTYTNGYNDQMGFGRVNAGNAIAYLKAPYKLIQKTETGGTIEDISSSQIFILVGSGAALPHGSYIGKRYQIKRTVQKPFCSGANYLWSRIEGASLGWSAGNPNDQENYIYKSNETSTTVDLTTWVYYIQSNSIGQTINTWYPSAPENVQFAYTALGLESYEIPSNSISGPSQICTTGTYTIPNLPTGATVTWSSSNNLLASISTSSNIGTLTKVANNGEIILTANIQTTCGNFTLTKNVILGSPMPETIQWNWNAPPNRVRLYVPPIESATNYKWYVDGVLKATTTTSNYDLPMVGNVSCDNSYHFGVKAVTNCGESAESYVYATMPECESFFTAYPNPSNNELKVGYKTADNINVNDAKLMAKDAFTIKIYNEKSQIMLVGESKDGKELVLNTNKLLNGIYYLHIYRGKEVIKKQIIIRH